MTCMVSYTAASEGTRVCVELSRPPRDKMPSQPRVHRDENPPDCWNSGKGGSNSTTTSSLEATSRTQDRNSGGRTFEKDCISLQTHTSLPVEDDEGGRSIAQDSVSASLQKYEGQRVDVLSA